MRKTLKTIVMAETLLSLALFCGAANAQGTLSGTGRISGQGGIGAGQVVYHPGQTIRISVTFEGPDVGKIKGIGMDLSIPNGPASQPGFGTSIYSGDSKPAGSKNTFEVSYKIPDTQASGDYKLTQLRAEMSTGTGSVTVYYASPSDFSVRTFTIDNQNTLVKPTIKDVKDLSHP